jgi:hypothetical protein
MEASIAPKTPGGGMPGLAGRPVRGALAARRLGACLGGTLGKA